MPTYKYRPATGGTSPFMKTRSNRRSRLFAGGTYFRSRESGIQWNNISITLVDPNEDDNPHDPLDPGNHNDQDKDDGALIVTNHNTATSENVEGPVDVVFLEQELNWNDRIVIDNLLTQPRARYYGISWQINSPLPPPVELGPVNLNGLIHLPPYLSAKVSLRTSEVTPTSTIVFKARTKIYVLKAEEKQVDVESGGESGGTTQQNQYGYDPATLRTMVNEQDPWIEMLERSGSYEDGSGQGGDVGGSTGQSGDRPDVQDDGVDDEFLSAFEDTYMEGGDGLPAMPNNERTGPSRSIIHINKGEKKNGEMGDVNVVYEWAGESSNSGQWKIY